MLPTKSICISLHHPEERDDYDDDEYEEVTVLTFEETEEDGIEEDAGTASGSEYFYYEEITIAEADDNDTVVSTRHDAGTVADPPHEFIVEDDHQGGKGVEESLSAHPHASDHHESTEDKDDDFSRIDESVVFRRAMKERGAPTTKLGRMASSSSSVAFSYANVGRRYDFVHILDDDDVEYDDGARHDAGRRQQCWNEWQTLASQSLFVEEDDDGGREDEGAAPGPPSPAPTSAAEAAAPVRDIYWEPPIKSVGWRWCGVGGGAAIASASPRRREHKRYLGFVLLLRGCRRKDVQPSHVEPQFLRFFATKTPTHS
jgi:hypothetical protein